MAPLPMQPLHPVPPERWDQLLADIAGERHHAFVSIEILDPLLGDHVAAHGVLLDGLHYDARDDLLEVATLRPTPNRPSVLRHFVQHPRQVDVDSPAGVLPSAIRVRGADEAVTVIRITTGAALSS